MDKEKFKKTVELIRAHKDCDIVLNLTTSGNLHATDAVSYTHLTLPTKA